MRVPLCETVAPQLGLRCFELGVIDRGEGVSEIHGKGHFLHPTSPFIWGPRELLGAGVVSEIWDSWVHLGNLGGAGGWELRRILGHLGNFG